MAIPYLYSRVVFIFCIVSCSGFAAVLAQGNETDLLALLDLKRQISEDPFQIMMSWNNSVHFCNWRGVTCDPSNQRVLILNLASQKLVGSLPASIGNLTFLTGINLRNNSFHGGVPQEIGRLRRLQHLNLTYNPFGGSIPTNLSHCTELRVLELSYNELVGNIPDPLSSLTKMLVFGLGGNNLSGGIPTWIGNFSSLQKISLALNSLEGNIPSDLGRLTSLGHLQLYGNQLSGTIPLEVFNISSIYFFSVTQNQLHGELPPNVGITLPNLETFAGGVNQFTGEIPVSLTNASNLGLIDFAQNGLTGTIPTVFGKLQGFHRINFDDNKLGRRQSGDLRFLSILANCTGLEVLGLSNNLFGGELPNSVANLSVNLSILTLGANFLDGLIPVGIGNLVSLTLLGLEGNSFRGRVPDTIGKLQYLRELHINYNKLSGEIPSSIGNLTSLSKLYMDNNSLKGTIPSELGSCRSLIDLNLTGNNLSGTIPVEIMGLSSLSISLSLAHNSLSGSLPLQISKLVNLMELDVSDNKLSGEIPSTLSSCLSLERLILSSNLLEGRIPDSLKALRGLSEMDLSHNNLSGEIPKFLGKFSSLKKLNLSFNSFVGEVPTEGIFANASAISIARNKKLCGGITDIHLPTCPKYATHKPKSPNLKVLIPAILSVAFLVMTVFVLAAFFAPKNSWNRRRAEPSFSKDRQIGISYQEVFKSTDGFSVNNLIGSGSFGSVYKGVLCNDGPIVAVKVLNLEQKGASKSFMDECKVLGSIRHRNLLKIVDVCSSNDPEGNDFKCIIFEFMSNGNLDEWLHTRNDDHFRTKNLNIIQRLNIAVDVASALDYLHNNCEIPIVHCDLKPSNILLDEDMTAHVGDFGLARFLFDASTDPRWNTITAGLKGSIGYIPPEYGSCSQVSTAGDVYSFGILLLELFTGKRPTDQIFKNGTSIYQYVATAVPGHVKEIVDPLLLLEKGKNGKDEDEDKDEFGEMQEKAIIHENGFGANWSRMEECLVSVLSIGLLCSKSLPRDRMPVNIVVTRMHEIRDKFCGYKRRNRSKTSLQSA